MMKLISTNRPRRVTVQLIDSPAGCRAFRFPMKSPIAGPRTEEKNDETDINPRAAQTERKRTVGVILHGVQGSGPHEAGIAGAAKRPRLAGKYQPGAGVPDAGMPSLRSAPRISALPVPVGTRTRLAAVEFVAELAGLFKFFGIGGEWPLVSVSPEGAALPAVARSKAACRSPLLKPMPAARRLNNPAVFPPPPAAAVASGRVRALSNSGLSAKVRRRSLRYPSRRPALSAARFSRASRRSRAL